MHTLWKSLNSIKFLSPAAGAFGLYIGLSTVRDLKTKEKSVDGWAFYALLTVAVAAAFLGILLRNVSYTVS